MLVPVSDVSDDLEPELVEVRDLYRQNPVMTALMGLFGVGSAAAVWLTLSGQVNAWLAAAGVLFALVLPLLAWTDLRTMRLPNKIVGPAALAALVAAVGGVAFGGVPVSTFLLALGTGLGLGLLMFIIAVVSSGLGMGDVKFVALAGSVIALYDPVVAVVATMILPPALAVVGVLPMLARFAVVQGRNPDSAKKMGQFKFAYGPYLVLGALAGLLFHTVLYDLFL